MTTVFALTGGIATGKSTVARHWAKQGLAVVSADELARQAVHPPNPGLTAVVDAFGPGVLAEDGSLARDALAALVFADAERLAQLNRIVHPEVRRLAAQRFEALADRGERLVCYELPLLYEAGLDGLFSPVVALTASHETQFRRLVDERGLAPEAARQRLSAQLPSDEKAARADYVISSDGSLNDTLARADLVLDSILQQQGLTREDLAQHEAS